METIDAGYIHPTAIIAPKAKIHDSCVVGPYCIVGNGVELGPRNVLKSHVVMENQVRVGEGNIFFPFSVIGAVPQDLKYDGEKTSVIIGNHNTIRESVTINIGTDGGGGVTLVGDQNLLMAYVHLGHDTTVQSHTVIANAVQVAGHVLIEDWAIIGGSSAIAQFKRIGAHSYVGGCSGVDRDVPRFVMGRGTNNNFEILGINIVGLKRRGFSSEAITALQEVNRLYFKDKSLEKEEALRRLETELGTHDVVQSFIEFVRQSTKGIYR